MLPLRFSLPRGASLDEAALRELWAFRASIMNLKPEVDLAADFAGFAAFLRRSERVVVLRDGRRVVGMTAVQMLRLEHEGERVVLATPEYVIFAPAARGSAVTALAYASTLALVVRPGDGAARWYLGGVGYPASVLMGERIARRMWLDGEPGIPPLERRMLDHLSATIAGPRRDPVMRWVDMPTRPPPLNPRVRAQPGYTRYVALNPRWQAGTALTAVFSMGGPQDILVAALRTMARRVRRITGAGAEVRA